MGGGWRVAGGGWWEVEGARTNMCCVVLMQTYWWFKPWLCCLCVWKGKDWCWHDVLNTRSFQINKQVQVRVVVSNPLFSKNLTKT